MSNRKNFLLRTLPQVRKPKINQWDKAITIFHSRKNLKGSHWVRVCKNEQHLRHKNEEKSTFEHSGNSRQMQGLFEVDFTWAIGIEILYKILKQAHGKNHALSKDMASIAALNHGLHKTKIYNQKDHVGPSTSNQFEGKCFRCIPPQ